MNPPAPPIRRARVADAEDFCPTMAHPETYAGHAMARLHPRQSLLPVLPVLPMLPVTAP